MARKEVLESDIEKTLSRIREKHLFIEDEIRNLLEARREEITLPVSIFSEKLGMLEAASIYLKDKSKLSFNDIAKLLKRDYKTIWTSYSKAKEKLKNAR